MKKVKFSKMSVILCLGLMLLWSFIADSIFYRNWEWSVFFTNKLYMSIKIIFILLLCWIGWSLFRFKMTDRAKKVLLYALPIFLLYSLLYLLIYPGIWYGDEMGVINALAEYNVVWLQGIMVTVWDALAMMCVPTPAFLQFVLIIFMAISAGMITVYVFEKFQNTVFKYLIYIPFLLPPTIYFVFYAHRTSTVAVLEIFIFIFVLYNSLYDKISVNKTVFLAIMIGILYGFRNETIILEISFIGFFLMLFRKKISKKQKCLITMIPIAILSVIVVATGTDRNTYSMAYTYNTLPYMVKNGEVMDWEREAIDQVVDFEDMKTWDNSYAHIWAWGEAKYRDFTDEEFEDFQKAFWSMALHNPKIYFETLIHTFGSVTSMDREMGLIFLLSPHHEFYSEKSNHNLDDRIAFSPLFYSVRLKLCNGLLLMENGWYKVFYNLLPAIFGIVTSFLHGLYKKKYEYVLVDFGVLGLGIVLFFMAPEAQFMYWLPIYYIGNLLLMMECIEVLEVIRGRWRVRIEKDRNKISMRNKGDGCVR